MQRKKNCYCSKNLLQFVYFLLLELCELTIIISEERCICDKCLVIFMTKNKYVFPSVDFIYIRHFLFKKKSNLISYFLCDCFYDKVIVAFS